MVQTSGLDVKAVRQQFSRRGAALAEADFLLREVERQLFERLDPIRLNPATAVDLGCGLGQGLQRLRQRYPAVATIGLDLAWPVLAEAHARLETGRSGWLSRLLDRNGRGRTGPALIQADAAALPLANDSADLLWSNLCLHWLADPEAAMVDWRRVLRPGGLLIFSAFGVDTLKEVRAAGARLMPFPDMHNVGDALVHAGFAEPVMDVHWITLTFDGLDGLLRDLRALGGNALADRPAGLLGRRRWQAWQAALEASCRRDGVLSLTFEIIFGHAWGAVPRAAPGDWQPVQFEKGRPAT